MARLYTYYSSTGTNTPSGDFDYRWFMDYTSTQDNAGNYSDITCKIYINFVTVRVNPLSTLWGITIDGTSYSGSVTTPSNCPTSYLLATRTKRVYHNTNGEKSVYVQGWGQRGDQASPARYTTNTLYVLPTIPRYATITTFSIAPTSVSNIQVTWGADVSCDAIQYSLNGGGWVNTSGYPTFNIGSLSAGTQYSVRIAVRRTDSQLWTYSDTLYATTHYNPTNITTFYATPNPLKEKETTTLSWSGATTAQGYIDWFDIYTRHYNGSTWTSYVFLKTAYAWNTTHKPIDTYPTLKAGDIIQYKIFTHNTSGGYSNGIEATPTLTIRLQSSADINISGTYKNARPWVNVNGTWKKGTFWTNVNGTWKSGV